MRKLLLSAAAIVGLSVASIGVADVANRRDIIPRSDVKIDVGLGHGSGVHIGNGLILTAAHVADIGDLTIRMRDGSTATATVLWSDKEHDVALLRADIHIPESPLSCKPLRIGQEVHAVGNPMAFDFVAVWGRVAREKIEVMVSPEVSWKAVMYVDITGAPGMSGGPIYDENNKVVGIVVGAWPIGVVYRGFLLIVPGETICQLMQQKVEV